MSLEISFPREWKHCLEHADGWDLPPQIFPGIDVHFLTLVGHFRLPLVRDYILLHGMLDCSRNTCKRVLSGCASQGTGHTPRLS